MAAARKLRRSWGSRRGYDAPTASRSQGERQVRAAASQGRSTEIRVAPALRWVTTMPITQTSKRSLPHSLRMFSLRAVSTTQRQCAPAEVHRDLASLARNSMKSAPSAPRTCQSAHPAALWAPCTRCPGLAYMEGNVRGPATADCEKWLHRTGILTATCIEKPDATLPAR